MSYMMVTHKVEDFSKWKTVFDQVKPMRTEAGEKSATIYRDASNRNTITAVFEWDSLDNARAYAESARLKTAMQEAGVTSKPDISFLTGV